METTRAILLRKIKLTETSLIVSWFTLGFGRLKTVAKGARQPKSRMAGMLDLFFDCEIQFQRSRRSELHILREVSLNDPHEQVRLDYRRVSLAAYFVELLELVTEPEHAAPELFDLFQRAIMHLDEKAATSRALVHFENELARLLGIRDRDVTAAVAISDVYHRLPAGRAALLKAIGS